MSGWGPRQVQQVQQVQGQASAASASPTGYVLGSGSGLAEARAAQQRANQARVLDYQEKEREKRWKKLEEKLEKNPTLKAATDIGNKLGASGGDCREVRQRQQESYAIDERRNQALLAREQQTKREEQLKRQNASLATDTGTKLGNTIPNQAPEHQAPCADIGGKTMREIRQQQQEKYRATQAKPPAQ